MTDDVQAKEVILIYDGDCPFCSHYSQLLRLRETVSTVQLVNARQAHSYQDEIKELGFDLDEGMLVKICGKYYHGADALHILALLSSPVDIFNRFNRWCFTSKSLSKFMYPVLRTGRNAVLYILGKSKINN